MQQATPIARTRILVKSLDSFFRTAPPATLDNCDSEKIHLSGQIQNCGALLILDAESTTLVGASENAGPFFGTETQALLGQSLVAIKPDLAKELAEISDSTGGFHEGFETQVVYDGTSYDVVTHLLRRHRFLELVPDTATQHRTQRSRMRLTSKTCAQVLAATDSQSAQQIAVDNIRALTGFARIKIYQFLPDWSGEVVAESRDNSMSSYLGLCFPAPDIPKQARALMEIVPFRPIGDVTDDVVPIRVMPEMADEIDLSWSMLRSVSPMHTAYLRNMGVAASFHVSLKHNDQLWGLIACHHNEPGMLPFDTWTQVQEIGNALMLRQEQDARENTAGMLARLRRIEARFASEVRRTGDVEQVIQTLVPVLQSFLRADGFAFLFGDNLMVSGRTPPDDVIRKIMAWGQTRSSEFDQYQTTKLPSEFPEVADHIETACGILIQPIVIHRVCQLMWFRGPITRKVKWAGDPSASKGDPNDPTVRLSPRNSFDTWVAEHRDQSLPWLPAELESAREIFREFLDIVAAQYLLKEENSSLRQFAHMAAHDLQTPLRGISLALELMAEEEFDQDVVKETHAIANQSAHRLQNLTESLLQLTMLEKPDFSITALDLTKPVQEAADVLRTTIEEDGGSISVASLPIIEGEHDLLLRLFLNLITNAAKYRSPDRPLRIEIACDRVTDDEVFITVSDNGIGVKPENAELIFQPMQRLHRYEDVEGTGLGLTICQRVLDRHGGGIHLNTDYTDGAQFVLNLPLRYTSPEE